MSNKLKFTLKTANKTITIEGLGKGVTDARLLIENQLERDYSGMALIDVETRTELKPSDDVPETIMAVKAKNASAFMSLNS